MVGPIILNTLYTTEVWLDTEQARAFVRAFLKKRVHAR